MSEADQLDHMIVSYLVEKSKQRMEEDASQILHDDLSVSDPAHAQHVWDTYSDPAVKIGNYSYTLTPLGAPIATSCDHWHPTLLDDAHAFEALHSVDHKQSIQDRIAALRQRGIVLCKLPEE